MPKRSAKQIAAPGIEDPRLWLLEFRNAHAAGNTQVAGDAAEKLAIRYHKPITGYLRGVFRPTLNDLADDVFNAFMLAFLYEKQQQYKPSERLEPFLYRCARNFASDFVRKLNRTKRHERLLEKWEDYSGDRDDFAMSDNRRDVDRLFSLLDDPKDREILVLRYSEEEPSLREIGEIVGLPPMNVHRRLVKSLLMLRAAVKPDGMRQPSEDDGRLGG